MGEASEAELVVIPSAKVLDKLLGASADPVFAAVSKPLASALAANARLLPDDERPIGTSPVRLSFPPAPLVTPANANLPPSADPVNEELRASKRRAEIEVATLHAEVTAMRGKHAPGLSDRIASAAAPSAPDADAPPPEPASALPSLPETLANRAKLADVVGLAEPVKELGEKAEAQRVTADQCVSLLQVDREFGSPYTDRSLTIHVDPTMYTAGGTPRGDREPPAGDYASPDATVTRSPFHSGGGRSPRLPTTSPNVTPRSRARQKLMQKSPRPY